MHTIPEVLAALDLTHKIATAEVVALWSDEQRRDACNWAAREFLWASGADVARRPTPPHVEVLPERNWLN